MHVSHESLFAFQDSPCIRDTPNPSCLTQHPHGAASVLQVYSQPANPRRQLRQQLQQRRVLCGIRRRTFSIFVPCIVLWPKEVRRQLAGGSLRPRHGRCRRRRSAQARKHANPAHAHKAACVRRGPMRPHSSCQRCLGSTATVPPPHSAPFLRLPRRRRRGVGAVRPLASAKTIQDTP